MHRCAEARQFIGEAEAPAGKAFVSPCPLAMAHAAIGEKDAAIKDLGRSAEAREGRIFYIKSDAMFDDVRADARFTARRKRSRPGAG